jgi:hypothetical protein
VLCIVLIRADRGLHWKGKQNENVEGTSKDVKLFLLYQHKMFNIFACPVLPENIIIDWKGLPVTKTEAFYKH